MYSYEKLPEGLRGGMKRYLEDGIQAGGFLTACLKNDLVGAVGKAGSDNLKALPEIVRWIYNEAPDNCWGSKEKVCDWMDKQYMASSNEGEKL